MNDYIMTYDNGSRRYQLSNNHPGRLAQAGDLYECVYSFGTLGNKYYTQGDKFLIMGRTCESPHHFYSSLGNLRIKSYWGTDHSHESVWSCFEHLIGIGNVKLINEVKL